MALIPAIKDALSPLVDLMRPIAALTLFPLIILLLGLGPMARAVVIFWTAWPAIVLNTEQAIRTVDRSVIEAARVEGGTNWEVFWHIIRPLATTTTLTGVRIGLSGGYISIVAAEMLGAQAGLGYAVLVYSQSFRFAPMYAMILSIGLWGLLMNLGLAWLQTYTDYEGESHVSSFLRFGDRAGSFALDSVRMRKRLIEGSGASGGEVRELYGVRPGIRGNREGLL